MSQDLHIQATIPDELLDRIADRIIERLKPVLRANAKEDAIMDVQALTEYLHIDKNWIYQRTRKHQIPYIKKGRYCLFRKSLIDTWLNEDAIKPLSPFDRAKK